MSDYLAFILHSKTLGFQISRKLYPELKTMKGGALVILAIMGLALPLFAAKEGPETLEIPEDKMTENLDFGDYEDSDDRSDEDSDEDYDELDR